MRRIPGSIAIVAAAAAWAAAPPASAELILFQEGLVVKAAGYSVLGEELEIRLPGGGSYRVDLARVERIVDDEVEVSDAADAARPDSLDGAEPAYDVSFSAASKPLFASPYDALIEREARLFDIDAALVSALIRAESNYQPRSVSRKGARGLMQLMPSTARRLGVGRPFDPAANVHAGVRYLRELADRFDGRADLMLAAYNAGENAVDAYGGVPPYRETVTYVKRILTWWKSPAKSAATPAAAAAGAAAGSSGRP